MERVLKGKVAVVTGASSGIGEATARELVLRGAFVVLASRAVDKLQALQREISASGGLALAVETDVSDRDSVEAMVGRTVGELGSLDILVNNAGLGLSGRITEVRAEDVRHVFEVNAIGPLNCIQSALPHMGKGGRIINVSSVVGRRAIPKVGAYCASKFALNALSDALRIEVADRGVSVTSVYPGTTRT
ncbi:MAG: SDR family oxidoreductase, partial [Actinomycetota bacterium]|nr:SDR family oxidoreductase [Actinomycetota bacterium]